MCFPNNLRLFRLFPFEFKIQFVHVSSVLSKIQALRLRCGRYVRIWRSHTKLCRPKMMSSVHDEADEKASARSIVVRPHSRFLDSV
jgi:hypothetical protein